MYLYSIVQCVYLWLLLNAHGKKQVGYNAKAKAGHTPQLLR